MFDEGILSPSVGLNNYKNHLRIQLEETQYLLQIADRSVVPDYDWVRHLFKFFAQELYGSSKPTSFAQSLKETIERNFTLHESCVFKELSNGDLVAAILTPVMKRALQAKTSSSILFMDTVGSVKFFELKVFFMVTQDDTPAGVIIVSNESERVLRQGFELFLTLVDGSCFGGRGKRGPLVLAAEDVCKKSSAFYSVFPESQILVSVFHFFQSSFKFLINAENDIDETDRSAVYGFLRRALFAENQKNFNAIFKETCEISTNEKLQVFLQRIFYKCKKWALCHLPENISRESVCSFMGPSMRTFRDRLLQTLKSRSAEDLVDFLTGGCEERFEAKLPAGETAPDNNVEDLYEIAEHKECDSIYDVVHKRKNVKYLVNTDVGICTCYKGAEGKYCKHQSVLQIMKLTKPSVAAETGKILESRISNDSGFGLVSAANPRKTDYGAPLRESHNGVDNIIMEPVADFLSPPFDVATEMNEEVSKLKENFEIWIDNLKKRPEFFKKGVTSMNEQLQKLVTSSPTAQLSALLNFNVTE